MSETSDHTHPAHNLDSLDVEQRLQLAVKAILNSPLRQDGQPELTIRAATRIYNVKRGTLTNCLSGMKTRKEAHAHECLLSEAQEDVLAEWAKTLGHRGFPVTLDMLGEYASEIAGKKVGINWPRKFMERHPELKIKKTAPLEQCRAQSLNPTVVAEFYEMLKDLIDEYNVPSENIYNADEKGIQLGVGKSVAAIIDRNQKNVQQVENGNREMVTIIEAICANGTSLPPSVIFQGKRCILEWGKENPCDARYFFPDFHCISVSEIGWTDQELGSMWLEKDFHPMSQKHNKTNGYRLLILDGHNSHCTFKFCRIAEQNCIIVVCLPSHTTHTLQPCDVGVFSPLSSSWKSLVNRLTRDGIPVTKYNFLKHYHSARHKAFKPSTIISAFAKSGIWPLNPMAIPIEAYEPAKNTTTQAAMPVSADLTPLLEVVEGDQTPNPNTEIISGSTTIATTSTSTPILSVASSAASNFSSASSSKRYKLVGIPLPLPHTAGRADLRKQIDQLRALLVDAQSQLERDHAIKEVMVKENERLRQSLYHKETHQKRTYSSSNPRHMTSEENMDDLAKAKWRGAWKALLKEAGRVFKLRRKLIEDAEKEAALELKKAQQDVARQECEAEKQKRDEEKATEREQKRQEREEKVAEKAAQKAAEKLAKETRKAVDKAIKEVEKAEKLEAAAALRATRGTGRGRGRSQGRGQGKRRGAMTGNRGQIQHGVTRGEEPDDDDPVFRALIAFNDEWMRM